jgi:hypothetical protein
MGSLDVPYEALINDLEEAHARLDIRAGKLVSRAHDCSRFQTSSAPPSRSAT